jgi:hypothetical protein
VDCLEVWLKCAFILFSVYKCASRLSPISPSSKSNINAANNIYIYVTLTLETYIKKKKKMQITNANPTKKDNQSIVVQSLFLAAFAGRSAALTQGRTSPLCDLMFKKTYKVVDKYMMHIHIYIYSFIHLHIRMYIQKKDCAFSKCFAS